MIKTPIKAIHCPIAVNRFFPLKIQNMLNIRWLYTKFYQAEVFKEIMVFGNFTSTESKNWFQICLFTFICQMSFSLSIYEV